MILISFSEISIGAQKNDTNTTEYNIFECIKVVNKNFGTMTKSTNQVPLYTSHNIFQTGKNNSILSYTKNGIYIHPLPKVDSGMITIRIPEHNAANFIIYDGKILSNDKASSYLDGNIRFWTKNKSVSDFFSFEALKGEAFEVKNIMSKDKALFKAITISDISNAISFTTVNKRDSKIIASITSNYGKKRRILRKECNFLTIEECKKRKILLRKNYSHEMSKIPRFDNILFKIHANALLDAYNECSTINFIKDIFDYEIDELSKKSKKKP
jgi:hypothetical protein